MEEKNKLKFPPGFLWGAATSAHQVEGGTRNNWSAWEIANSERLTDEARKKWPDWQKERFPEMFDPQNYVSGRTCDHYNLYEKDFDIAKELGHNAHRFSIEWSRVEPSEGKFDEKEIEHYRAVIKALKKRGLEPFVTLWHWTNPLWLEERGGCESKEFPFCFSRYAGKMAEYFKDEIKFWITVNEPTSVIANAYLRGHWPPQKKSFWLAWKMFGVFAQSHIAAYEKIHRISPEAQVGFANILHSFEPYRKKNFLDKLGVAVAKYLTNRKMLKLTRGFNDFLAVQYYFHNRFKFPSKNYLRSEDVSDLNWEIYPHGIYRILRKLKEYKLPIYVTENGLADAADSRRAQFIKDHLFWMHKAISEGADVRGYFYWSLLDNFEWDKGFWPRFGLVEIDYKTLERKVRPSAREYAKICKNNELEV